MKKANWAPELGVRVLALVATAIAILPTPTQAAPEALTNFRITSRVTDCTRQTDRGRVRIERVWATSRDMDDEVIFIVCTTTDNDGKVLDQSEWQVASTKQRLKVRFHGWKGGLFSWRSEAPWGGHEGQFDHQAVSDGVKVLLTWDI